MTRLYTAAITTDDGQGNAGTQVLFVMTDYRENAALILGRRLAQRGTLSDDFANTGPGQFKNEDGTLQIDLYDSSEEPFWLTLPQGVSEFEEDLAEWAHANPVNARHLMQEAQVRGCEIFADERMEIFCAHVENHERIEAQKTKMASRRKIKSDSNPTTGEMK